MTHTYTLVGLFTSWPQRATLMEVKIAQYKMYRKILGQRAT